MSLSEEQLRLRIVPATLLTEITVTDARFRKIPLDANVGTIELELPRGVYEIGFRDGTSIELHLVVLQPNQTAPAEVKQKPQAIDADMDADSSEDTLGDEPSQMLVVVGNPPRSSYDPAKNAPLSSATRLNGLSLVTEYGKPIAAGESSMSETRSRLPFPAGPGRYRLRVQTGVENQAFETPIVVCPGWNTRASLRTRAYRPGDYRADFTTIRIRMHPADGSRRPTDEECKLEANARASLSWRRTLGGRAFKDLLRRLVAQKYLNPMFGFYAGHLLRGSDPEEIETLAVVVKLLEDLVGKGPDRNLAPPAGFVHPDVEALKLRLNLLRKEDLGSVQPFPFPPMLAAGWRTVIQIADRRQQAIPAGSLSDRIANRVVAAGAFTVWVAPSGDTPVFAVEAATPESPKGVGPQPTAARKRRSTGYRTEHAVSPPAPNEQASTPTVSPNEGIRLINAALHDERLRHWFREASGMSRGSSKEERLQSPIAPILGKAERMVAQSIHAVALKEQWQPIFDRARVATEAEQPAVTSATLATELRLPVTTVERAIDQLSARLVEQARLLSINLSRGQPCRDQN